jgi:transcriptional regulator with XRE-family HTH domain
MLVNVSANRCGNERRREAGMSRNRYDYAGHADMIAVNVLISRGLRRVRMQRRLTLERMGAVLGMSASQLSRIENGKRAIGAPDSYADALEITTADLLALCPQCGYEPDPGWECGECGSARSVSRLLADAAAMIRQMRPAGKK